MDATEDFISSFHSLTGYTIGERRKSLFYSLRKYKLTEVNTEALQPWNPLEENFKIDVLLYFNKVPELMKIIKSGNTALINRVLKNDSFIQNAFLPLSVEYMVNQIFPYLSYNIKLKVMTKLVLNLSNEQQADDLFNAIYEKYGLYLASKMIASCSAELVLKLTEKYRIEITPGQLLIIVKRHPKIAMDLLTQLSRHYSKLNIIEKYVRAFVFMAEHHTSLCLQLYEKFKPRFKVGTRVTRRLVKINKSDFLTNPQSYINFLRKDEIGKALSKQELDQVFNGVFPKTIAKVKETITVLLQLLKNLSNKEKLSLFLTTFRTIYSCEIWEYQVLIKPELLELMDGVTRENLIETLKRPNHISESEWITFMTCQKSIPLLQEKISGTKSRFDHAHLYKFLARTCKINNDNNALLDVLSFMSERRKEWGSSEFLKTVNNSFNLLHLSDLHWKYLMEYVEDCKENGYNFPQCWYILGQYVHYCSIHNLPVVDMIISWATSPHVKFFNFSICKEYAPCEKYCLDVFSKAEPHNFNVSLYIEYIHCVYNWNERHPNDRIVISVKSDAIERALEKITDQFPLLEVVETYIYDNVEQSHENNVLSLFFNRTLIYSNQRRVALWLLKNHPLKFKDHINTIINKIKLKEKCTYYAHLGIPQKIQDINLQSLNEEAVESLSFLMDAKEFQKFCENDNSRIKHFKNSRNLHESLDYIIQFCKYDYLKEIQRVLYVIAHNVAEYLLVPFFERLSNSDTYIQKHVIFLTFKVLSKHSILTTLENFEKSNINTLVRKCLFKGIFNFFIRSPDDRLWDLTQHSIQLLDKNDYEALRILTHYRRIPHQYLSRYVILVWNVLENNLISTVLDKNHLLEALSIDKLHLIPEDFCLNIISKYLFKCDFKIVEMTCRFIIFKPECMKSIFQIIQELVSHTWSNSYSIRRQVSEFAQTFCEHFLKRKATSVSTLQLFLELWTKTFKPNEVYSDYLIIHFTLMYLDLYDHKSLSILAENLVEFCNSLEEKGIFEFEIFSETFQSFRLYFYEHFESNNNYNQLILIENLLKLSNSTSCIKFVICLLPIDEVKECIKDRCMSVVQQIQEKLNNTTVIYFFNYLQETRNTF